MTLAAILASAAGGLACLAALPYALPGTAVIEREALIDAEPAAIYALLDGAAGFQRINPWRDADPELEITLSGPERGVGSAFAFKGAEGTGAQTVVAVDPGREVVTEIDLGPLGKPVQTFTIAPVGKGARVVWRTEAAFGLNPIGRVIGLFMDGRLGPVYERGLKNIAGAV
ncbi:MAG: SRPBCC family protein [Pseudomonadota bacterium]